MAGLEQRMEAMERRLIELHRSIASKEDQILERVEAVERDRWKGREQESERARKRKRERK